MSAPQHPDHERETVFLHELSPELERELLRRAAAAGRDPGEEAAHIIEQQIGEDGTH